MAQELYKLPKGWEWKTIGNVAAEIASGFACNKDNEVPDGYLHLRTHNIDTSGKLNFDLLVKIDHSKIELKKAELKKGDILFNNTNSKELVGKSAFVEHDYSFAFSNHLTRIRVLSGYSPQLLVYWLVKLQSSGYFSSICKCWIGQAGINSNILKTLSIPLPPLSEQKRIVAKLDSLLSRIDSAVAHLQESLTLSKSMLQSILNQEFASIQNRHSLESLVEVKGGKRLPKDHDLLDEPTNHPYIRVSDFTDKGTIDTDNLKYISESTHKEIQRYIISADDLYISIAGTIGKTGFVPTELNGANLTENAAKLVIKDKKQLNLNYLYLFTLTTDFSEQAGLATKQVAQPKLALTRLSKIEIPICSFEEQVAIVEKIELLKAKIHSCDQVLHEKIKSLSTLKSSLLDTAFKGQL